MMRNSRLERWLHNLGDASGIHRLVAHHHRHRRTGNGYGRWSRLLFLVRHSRVFPAAVGVLAVISAATGLYPFAPVLIAAIVLAPLRWRAIYLASICGAAIGAMLCAEIVQVIGSPIVAKAFPDVEHSSFWEQSVRWIGSYGWAALVAIAALPIPQMPALIFSALAQLNPLAIGMAIFLGKAIKYAFFIAIVQLALQTLHRVAEKIETS